MGQGAGAAGDFGGQVAAMRQLSQLQGELADAKMSMTRLRQQAEEDHSRYAGWWVCDKVQHTAGMTAEQ
jgi:hypothetical protein